MGSPATRSRGAGGQREFRDRYRYPYGVHLSVDLLNVLLAACRTFEPDRAAHRQEGSSTSVDSGDRVTVTTAMATTLEGCALVGADGLWSKLRERIRRRRPSRASRVTSLSRGAAHRRSGEEYRPNSVVLWAGPKTHLVHYPLRRGELFNLVAVFHSDRYEEGWNVLRRHRRARFCASGNAHPTVKHCSPDRPVEDVVLCRPRAC